MASRGSLARSARRMLDGTTAAPPDVVVGDFNMTRGSYAVRTLFPGLEHAYDQAGRSYGATFHRAFPLVHIDHVLLGEQLRATSYQLPDPGVGRHLYQIVELEPAG